MLFYYFTFTADNAEQVLPEKEDQADRSLLREQIEAFRLDENGLEKDYFIFLEQYHENHLILGAALTEHLGREPQDFLQSLGLTGVRLEKAEEITGSRLRGMLEKRRIRGWWQTGVPGWTSLPACTFTGEGGATSSLTAAYSGTSCWPGSAPGRSWPVGQRNLCAPAPSFPNWSASAAPARHVLRRLSGSLSGSGGACPGPAGNCRAPAPGAVPGR